MPHIEEPCGETVKPWKSVQSSFKMLYTTSAQRVKLALGADSQGRGNPLASPALCHYAFTLFQLSHLGELGLFKHGVD